MTSLPVSAFDPEDVQRETAPLEEGLQQLRQFKGEKKLLKQADLTGEKLLDTHRDRKAQAAILFTLADIHAQSGMVHPEKVIEYADRALAIVDGLDPGQRARLHVYWGDALRVIDSIPSTVEKRKQAAIVYLRGLKEVLDMNLPSEPPQREVMGFYDGPDVEEKQRLQWERRKEIDFQREMIRHREVLTRQISSIYKRKPYNRQELLELAEIHLQHPDYIQEHFAELPASLIVSKPQQNQPDTLPERRGDGSWWIIVVLNGVILALLSMFFVIRSRKRSRD